MSLVTQHLGRGSLQNGVWLLLLNGTLVLIFIALQKIPINLIGLWLLAGVWLIVAALLWYQFGKNLRLLSSLGQVFLTSLIGFSCLGLLSFVAQFTLSLYISGGIALAGMLIIAFGWSQRAKL